MKVDWKHWIYAISELHSTGLSSYNPICSLSSPLCCSCLSRTHWTPSHRTLFPARFLLRGTTKGLFLQPGAPRPWSRSATTSARKISKTCQLKDLLKVLLACRQTGINIAVIIIGQLSRKLTSGRCPQQALHSLIWSTKVRLTVFLCTNIYYGIINIHIL